MLGYNRELAIVKNENVKSECKKKKKGLVVPGTRKPLYFGT
jgi:hypothetical protein